MLMDVGEGPALNLFVDFFWGGGLWRVLIVHAVVGAGLQ